MGPLLGAEAAALRLSVVSLSVESAADLDALRRHTGATVDTIQAAGYDAGGLSASF